MVTGAPGESWKAINHALALGLRGLPGDSSLAELLAEHRGAPLPDMSPQALAEKIWAWEQEQFPVKGPRRRTVGRQLAPRLSIAEILAWADAHHEATGRWPDARSGLVLGAPFEVTWSAIQGSLFSGHRGLPGGYTLRSLFVERRNAYSGKLAPGDVLSIAEILAWADAHHEATGEWPNAQSGPVQAAPVELSWAGIQSSLFNGHRSLPGGGYTLHRLFAEHRDVHSLKGLPREPLSVAEILAWADAHHEATGEWPHPESGRVLGAPFELDWVAVDRALNKGFRSLPGGSSLNRLLVEHRGIHDRRFDVPLDIDQILAWADAYHAAHGAWPTKRSGRIEGNNNINWRGVDRSLSEGWRGLTGGSSLSRLLAERRGDRSGSLRRADRPS